MSIGALIRETVRGLDSFDTGVVVDAVMDRISPDDYEAFLREVIGSRVSSELSRGRAISSRSRPSRSMKQALIRDEWWPRFLEQHVALPSGWKRLRDATVDDLRALAAQRREQAGELWAWADRWERLADRMVEARVARLGDLDAPGLPGVA